MSVGAPRSHYETFEAIKDAYFAGDLEGALALIDPEVEWIEPEGLPGAGTYRGHQGVRESMTRFVGAWEDYRVEHHDVSESGDSLLLRAHITGKGRTSGVPVELDQFQVWTFRNGRAVRLEMFLDEGAARRAAGIDPASDPAEARG